MTLGQRNSSEGLSWQLHKPFLAVANRTNHSVKSLITRLQGVERGHLVELDVLLRDPILKKVGPWIKVKYGDTFTVRYRPSGARSIETIGPPRLVEPALRAVLGLASAVPAPLPVPDPASPAPAPAPALAPTPERQPSTPTPLPQHGNGTLRPITPFFVAALAVVMATVIFSMRLQIEQLFWRTVGSSVVVMNHDVPFDGANVQIEESKAPELASSATLKTGVTAPGTVAQPTLASGPTQQAKLLANTIAAVLFGRPLPMPQIGRDHVSAGRVDMSELKNLDSDVDLALARIRVEMALEGDGYLADLEKARRFQIEVKEGQIDVLIETLDGMGLFDALWNAMGSVPRLRPGIVRMKTGVLKGQNVIDGPYFHWSSKTDEGIVQTVDQGVLISVRPFGGVGSTGPGDSPITSN